MKRLLGLRLVAPVVLVVLGVSAPAVAEQGQPTAVATPGIVKFSPNLSAAALAKRPDTDLVELSDGRRIRLGDVRRLTAAAKKMRAAKKDRLPAALRAKPAPTGTPLRNAEDLAAALKRADNETVVLPSGRRTTVGMIRLVQPQLEKRLGRPLAGTAMRPNLSGPAVRVTAGSDWKDLLQRPDGTVLEAPNGTRITVGELKESFAVSSPARRLPPPQR
jgi:hypothetical protein